MQALDSKSRRHHGAGAEAARPPLGAGSRQEGHGSTHIAHLPEGVQLSGELGMAV